MIFAIANCGIASPWKIFVGEISVYSFATKREALKGSSQSLAPRGASHRSGAGPKVTIDRLEARDLPRKIVDDLRLLRLVLAHALQSFETLA
jgi:hypothetical protein